MTMMAMMMGKVIVVVVFSPSFFGKTHNALSAKQHRHHHHLPFTFSVSHFLSFNFVRNHFRISHTHIQEKIPDFFFVF